MAHELPDRTYLLGSGFKTITLGLAREDVIVADGEPYVPVLFGNTFTAVHVRHWPRFGHDHEYFIPEGEWGLLHRPVHPSMTLDDVNGATHWWDDGTYWHFAHATPAQHHDLEALICAVGVATIQPYKDRELVNIFSETAGTPLHSVARGKFFAWQQFQNALINKAQTIFEARNLGHFHRNPGVAHIRQTLAAAATEVHKEWDKLKDAPNQDEIRRHFGHIGSSITSIATSLRRTTAITTWPAHRAAEEAARKAEEAKKKEAEDANAPADPPAADPPAGE